jgi:hypothetical protein
MFLRVKVAIVLRRLLSEWIEGLGQRAVFLRGLLALLRLMDMRSRRIRQPMCRQ